VDYVNHLYAGIKRNTTVEFKFHCFTDDETDIIPQVICHKLPNNRLTGWWNKLWLFSNELPIENGQRVMFFDLDTLITGNIDDILNYSCPNDMIGLKNFYHPTRFASGLMMWKHGTQTHIWEKFLDDPIKAQQSCRDGDQEWTERYLKSFTLWQEEFPNCVYSYKQSCGKGLPATAKIVCYHGTPSIIQSFTETVKNSNGVWLPQQWPKEYWRL
jgi:hypothetical protein